MAILAKCSQCKRVGGFAKSKDSKICARCKNTKGTTQPREGKPNEDGENKSLNE